MLVSNRKLIAGVVACGVLLLGVVGCGDNQKDKDKAVTTDKKDKDKKDSHEDPLKKARAEFDESMKSAPEFAVVDLMKIYKEDREKAQAKYGDKWVKVKGKVKDIAFQSGIMALEGVPGKIADLDVQFDPGAQEGFKDVKKGDEITVGGIATKGAVPGILLDKARLIKK